MPRRSKVVASSPAKASAKTSAGHSGKSGGGRKKSGSGGQTPMMEQFWRAKKEQPDALLFFRMGDFYELFGEDAVVAARELGIALTSRAKGTDALPMAGVPVRAMEGYLVRLVQKGFKVAICEQLTDPKESKGIVERGIVRVVTAGTLTEEDALDRRKSNFLASVWFGKRAAGLAWVDVSTGRFLVTEVPLEDVGDEIGRIGPAELVWPAGTAEERPELGAEVDALLGPRVSEREEWRFARDTCQRVLRRHFRVATLEGFGVDEGSAVVPAAGALVEYLEETQRNACEHVRRIEIVEPAEHLVLDRATRSCLELVATQREGRSEGTLLDAVDATLTPMGGRLLREWLLSPLRRVQPIVERQRGVAELVESPFLREDVRKHLGDVLDVERLVAKISTGRANGRDLIALSNSMAVAPALRDLLENAYSSSLANLREALDPLGDLTDRIRRTLVDEPPTTIKEGGLIREGIDAELDEYRQLSGDAKSWMVRYQASESDATGIQGLKIGFNSVFGYYLEVPRAQVEKAPEAWTRKQTLKNCERYITPELKEFETKALEADEKSRAIEYRLFGELRDALAEEAGRILDTAHALAQVDVLAGLAQRAAENDYVAPTVDGGDTIRVIEGRHPVIERSPACETFVPNDCELDRTSRNITILTGPNMAGKSTYIRQVALITLLAQIGSFVPAEEATIGVVDRIFTRVGAGDDISRGASTFMVEMVEIANILNNATSRSLVILDEVGRGTSTFDGLALAWAIVEHLRNEVGARTLFATHYHQLTELADRHPEICNKCVAVREWGEEIVFLHKIVDGGTDRSYGIHVARLAGVPTELLDRAKEILHDLEDDAVELVPRVAESAPQPAASEADDGAQLAAEAAPEGQQLSLFDSGPSRVERELAKLDPDRLSPIDALLELRKLRELLQRSR